MNRNKYIGSSDIAAILGVSKWTTALDVWEEKTGVDHEDPSPEQLRRFRRGKLLEPVIVEMVRLDYGIDIELCGERYFSETLPVCAEIDAIGRDDDGEFNVELKSVDPRAAGDWGPSGGTDIPHYYLAQVMFAMAVTGKNRCLVAALIGDDLRIYWIDRDEELCSALLSEADSFWNTYVLTGTHPPLQTKEDRTRILSKLKGIEIIATGKIVKAMSYLKKIKKLQSSISKKIESVEAEIQNYIVSQAESLQLSADGSDFSLIDGDAPIATWKKQSRAGYTVNPAEFWVFRTIERKRK